MTFRIGQKVVRVSGVDCSLDGFCTPPLGKPCTIANVYVCPFEGVEVLEILEYPLPETRHHLAGQYARHYRPVVTRKTDISLFTKMLTPTDKVPA